jgi:hypothetical protein
VEEPHPVGDQTDLRNFSYTPDGKVINQLFIDFLHMPARDSIANQMLSLEQFDLAMGYQRGDGYEVPISLVTMKGQRDIYKESEWERTLRVLAKFKLHNVTGLNIMQQLELPRPMLKTLLDICSEIGTVDTQVLSEMEKAAKKAGEDKAKKQ